jgi:hypothetical protein
MDKKTQFANRKRQGPIGCFLRLPHTLRVAVAITALAASPLLYALSAGPAIWLCQHDVISRQTWLALVVFYEPMNRIGGAWRPIGDLWDIYLDMWEPFPQRQASRRQTNH